jgi:NAD-reducing hydrogenase small subunit
MAKIKVATAWLDGCSGCHMSFLDIDEGIIELSKAIEFSRSPLTDYKEFSPVDLGIVEGAVGNVEQEETLKKLRANCRILMVWGDCACFGGIASMRNSFDVEDVIKRSFVEMEGTVGGESVVFKDVPPLLKQIIPVNQVVKVDCYVPGCPPSADVIKYALGQILKGRIPVLPSEEFRYGKGVQTGL